MKMIRPLLLLLSILFLNSAQLSAQRPGGPPPPMTKEQREEIESMKIAFLTKRLELTPDEAKKFWPVYNQSSSEVESLREARRKQHQEMRQNRENLSDKDYERIVDSEISFRQQELDIMKKYNVQYKQILPMKKVASLYKAEEDFKRELLEKMRDRKNQGGQGGSGSPKQKE